MKPRGLQGGAVSAIWDDSLKLDERVYSTLSDYKVQYHQHGNGKVDPRILAHSAWVMYKHSR